MATVEHVAQELDQMATNIEADPALRRQAGTRLIILVCLRDVYALMMGVGLEPEDIDTIDGALAFMQEEPFLAYGQALQAIRDQMVRILPSHLPAHHRRVSARQHQRAH